MALHLHRSNRVERLADALGDLLAEPVGGPFEPELVVVPSAGMERWLAMRLAERLGVCAHVRFPLPDAFVRGLMPGADWSAQRLTWAVLGALPGLLDDPRFVPVRDYLEAGTPLEGDRRRVTLAARIAESFADYAVLRPEMARAWSAGAEAEDWQPVLWRAVRALAGPSPAEAEVAAARLPARLAVFAPTSLPALHLEVLQSVARTREVHLFVPSPTAAAKPSHPLLVSLDRLGRAFRERLADDATASFVAPPEDSLLHALQADLLHGHAAASGTLPADGTIQNHACHGAMRQVEVLRDVLLRLFSEDVTLQPRDVAVMAPDIDAFAPLIAAVFSDPQPVAVPYRLSDRGLRATNPAAEALLAVLALVPGRFEASKVLDVLALAPIRQRFGIEEEALGEIQAWVVESGIRWGIDAAHRAAHGQPPLEEHTWRCGLDRLVLGQAMAADEALVLGRLPLDRVEDKGARHLLGAFADFFEALAGQVEALGGRRSPAAWRAALTATVDALIGSTVETEAHVQRLRDALRDLDDEAVSVGFDGTLDLGALRALLEARFATREPGRAFLAGGVTFCGLVPARRIPFRVVCLLGLDDGAFPRTVVRPGFDRVAADPHPGDRSPRDDDRSLFVEALLSAREHFVVLHTGRGPRDHEPRPPAAPVVELLDAVEARFGPAVRAAVCLDHPLHGFSPRAFVAPDAFDPRLLAAAEATRGPRRPPPPFFAEPLPPVELRTLTLERLASFLENPIRDLFTRRLGVWLGGPAAVADREPLALDGLGQWSIRNDLLAWRLAGESVEVGSAAFARVRASGRLPPGTAGEVEYVEQVKRVAPIVERVAALRAGGPRPPVEVEIDLDGTCLTGRVGDLWAGGRLQHLASWVKAKHRLRLWLYHLALHAAGADWSGVSVVVGHRRAFRLAPPRVDPRALLAALVDLYRRGQEAPLPAFPDAAEAYAQALGRSDDPRARARAVDAARREWGGFGDPDEYARWALGDGEPFADERFHALALSVWRPLLDHLERC